MERCGGGAPCYAFKQMWQQQRQVNARMCARAVISTHLRRVLDAREPEVGDLDLKARGDEQLCWEVAAAV